MFTRSKSKRKLEEEEEEKKEQDITNLEQASSSNDKPSSASLEELFKQIEEDAKVEVITQESSRKKIKQNEIVEQQDNKSEEEKTSAQSNETKAEVIDERKPAALPKDSEHVKQQQSAPLDEGKHVAALNNPSPSSITKKQSPSILNEDDLGVIYDYVQNDCKGRILNSTQRIYYQGTLSDSFTGMQNFANSELGNDKEKMLSASNDMAQWAQKSYADGDMKMAVARIVDSKMMSELANSNDRNNSIYQQASNAMAI